MDNYQWAISTKHLTYPEYRRMIYPLKAVLDAAYEPGYDTIYIEPADSRLKVHHAELTVDYSNETKPIPLLKDLRCAGSMSGILGDCKIGEAVAFQLSYSIDYVQLKEKNDILFTGQTISIEPKSVIRISQCCMAMRSPLISPRWTGKTALFLKTLPDRGYACPLFCPNKPVLRLTRIG